MRTLMWWVVMLAVAGHVTVLPAFAQGASSPSAESIDWLRTYLGGAACVVFEMGASREELAHVVEGTEVMFSGCEMTLATSYLVGSEVRLYTYRVHLGRLDPAAVTLTDGVELPDGWVATGEVPANTVHLVARNGERIIAVREEWYEGDETRHSDYFVSDISFRVRDAAAAETVASAFARAMTFCAER